MNRWRRLAGTFSVSVICAACAGTSPTVPAPAENRAPTVAVAFAGASTCTPRPDAPCTLEVVAQATDPDGDPLQYSWSGCASGTAARATCSVTAVGAVTASVAVSDGHGHTVTGSVAGNGLAVANGAPTVTVGFQSASSCALLSSKPCVIDVFATATDPDGDPLTYRWSGCATGTAPKAPCTIDRVGAVLATVDVSDDHGHTVSGSVSAEGRPDPNTPPVVHVAFDALSQCTPLPAKPCTLGVTAQATDAEGDPLHYSWSGCASGSAPRATCTIDRPGTVAASVEVSDDHGHTVSGSISATGANQPPNVQIGHAILLPSGLTIDLLGNVNDPDEGTLCGRQYCVSAVASGACGGGAPVALDCTCLGGLEAQVKYTAAAGTCNVTFTLQDSWGQIGTPTYSFDVSRVQTASTVIKRN